MLEPLVIAYVGEEHRGLDVVRTLDQRLRRPVHLLTTRPESISAVLDRSTIDGVVCGLIDSDDLQSTVDSVADSTADVPVFDLSNTVAAVPECVSLYKIYGSESPTEAANKLVGTLLDSPGGNRQPRTLGQYISLDSSWQVADWDRRLESWTGLSPDDAVGEQFWELLPGWKETQLGELFRRVFDDRVAETTDLYHEPTGRWLDCRVVALDAGGIECFIRDVTEHRQGDPLDGPTDRFDDMLERITDAFFALDNEDRFVLLNSDAEAVFDIDANEVTGIRFWDAFPAAISSRFYREFNDAMQSQEPVSFEERYHPTDSWFEVNVYPSEGGLSVFLRDITDQVKLQQKLESLHTITRELIVAESDTEIAGETVDAAEEVLEFPLVTVWRHDDTAERLEPLAWSEEIDDRVEEMNALGPESEFIWEVYETGEHRELGFVPATTATSHHPGKVSSELLVPVGDFGVLGAYADERGAFDDTDVELFRLLASTVESAFARTLRERQLAKRNERLNDFASVVSHDLRNPLNVAWAHAELAKDAEDVDPHLDKIDSSLTRMEDLIEDLLARARGDQDLDRESLAVEAVARAAWSAVDTAAATLVIDQDSTLNADPDRLQQLFENLFRNAVEHGREDVTIRIGTTEDGLFVADDGPGIPDEKQADIFEQGVTHSESGTGYGLSIVTDIVDGHGWSIDVSTSRDGGARFDIDGIRSLAETTEQSVES